MDMKAPDARVVLIAERDQKVRDLQRYYLEKAGMVVEFADDGQAAFDYAAATRPSAVITEILIPRMDGLTLCRRLREDPLTCNVPVVVFSILAAAVRAEEAGAKAFLRKPLVESIFVATVQDVIAAQSSAAVEEQWAPT